MVHAANPDFLTDITEALDWWRSAGVDCDFLDEPQSWLVAPEEAAEPRTGTRPSPAMRPKPSEPEAAPQIDAEGLPGDLDAFIAWWMSAPLLDEGNTRGRIAPHGPVRPPLMIVVDEPEAEDRGDLLSGAQGRFIDAILTAAGLKRGDIYLASALPRHTPAADWHAARQLGIGKTLAHHISLVQPERLLVASGNILPLIGHELPQGPAALRQFNQEGSTIPMLASWGLSSLMRQPPAKKTLWMSWLEWTAA